MLTGQVLVEVFGSLVTELHSTPALIGFLLIATGLVCLVMSSGRSSK
jgi:hypothetical protein